MELCCYGHLHGPVIRRRMEGKYGKTVFSLISGDYLGFEPKKFAIYRKKTGNFEIFLVKYKNVWVNTPMDMGHTPMMNGGINKHDC